MTSAAEKFIELASPNEKGESNWVTYSEWERIGLKHDNGSQWCQTDRGVGIKYTFEKQYSTINGRRRVSAIRLTGLKTNKTDSNYRDHSIPRTIQQMVINRPSTILYVHSQNECDHKDGRYSKKATDIDQFQCLSKAENDAKRQHCKNCRKYNKRFDAKVLGYKIGWIKGNENSNFCEGCYWYDPYKFNEVISSNAKIN